MRAHRLDDASRHRRAIFNHQRGLGVFQSARLDAAWGIDDPDAGCVFPDDQIRGVIAEIFKVSIGVSANGVEFRVPLQVVILT